MSRDPELPDPEEPRPQGFEEPHDLGLPDAFPPPADEAPLEPYDPDTEQRVPAGAPGDVPAVQVIAVLGDITVTPYEVITPAGSFPLAGSEWTLEDRTQVERVTPPWAVVTAVAAFPVVCVLSLLFLIVKEDEVRGDLQITVRSNEIRHSASIRVGSVAQAHQVHQYFNYVRSLASDGY
jgi:hypothetical protein